MSRLYPKVFVSLSFLAGCFLNLAAEDAINFNRDIRPILSDKCFHCHGPDEVDREEELRMDVPDGPLGALTPRDDYFIIKPGEPEESEVYWRIIEEYEDERMPPADSHKSPLTEDEVELVKQWITEGAKYEDFWAFAPPIAKQPAKVKNPGWVANSIDNRVLAMLEGKGLQPKPEADKRTLIRRLTFDLTGLPPTLEEIDAYFSDDSVDAYEKLVDRILAKPAYGEHMARYWADLVRLSDTNGMHKDFHRDFSTYRDWLIRSFNDNLPYDEFVKYQLAGDLYEEPTREQLIASGFNRMHMIIDVGTALPEESLHKNVVDRVEAFGTAFLGLTVQCAQCHDHKYDPITQKDYFQLYAFFNNFSGAAETIRRPPRGLQPPFINLTSPRQDRDIASFDANERRLAFDLNAVNRVLGLSDKWPKKFEEMEVPWIWDDSELAPKSLEFETELELDQVPEFAMARFVSLGNFEVLVNGELVGKGRSRNEGIAAELSGLLKVGKNVISANVSGKAGFAFILEYREGGTDKTIVSDHNWLAKEKASAAWEKVSVVHELSGEHDWTTQVQSFDALTIMKELDQLEKDRIAYLEGIPGAMFMSEKEPPRQTFILQGGDYEAPGEPVERNTPGFLPPMKEKEGRYSRMDLAEWLVRPDHPLIARVAVNRVWQQLMGVGLVKTSEDFGAQGEWPSHPDLLDDLAVSFVKSGWDVKRLLRMIVLSNTYKQASDAKPEAFVADPENRLLARGSRYRMDAEMIRDQILTVSGQLNPTMYGKSVKPPQPPGLWEMVSMDAPFTYVADTDDNIYRRSFYTYWRRGMPPPQMTILNAPSREFCVTRRERTNTPLQALLLMNESEYFNAAKETAKRVLAQTDSVKSGLDRVYELVTSHVPEADRLALMIEALEGFKDYYRSEPSLAESMTPELEGAALEKRVDLAAWTMVTHSLLNLELAKVRR